MSATVQPPTLDSTSHDDALRDADAPTVSVVIAAYNAEAFIQEALDSVLAQTYRDYEVIVVDDGSTDATAERVRRYGEAVRLVQQANAGSAAARNRGIQEARGTYVAFLDADDLWLPEKLERQVGLHEAGGPRWSYTDAWHVDAATGAPLSRWSDTHPAPEGDVAPVLLCGNFITAATALVDRSVLTRIGGFPETLPGRASISEDWALWLRIAVDHPVARVPEPCAQLRQHGGRKTETMNLQHALDARVEMIRRTVERAPARLGPHEGSALAAVHLGIARKWMNRGDVSTARSVLREGLRRDPRHLPSLVFLLLTWLPTPLRKALGRIRTAYRSHQIRRAPLPSAGMDSDRRRDSTPPTSSNQ